MLFLNEILPLVALHITPHPMAAWTLQLSAEAVTQFTKGMAG